MTEPGLVTKRSKIHAVIFDMDGVLTDSEPLINAAAIAMFKETGLQVQPEDFLPFIGTGEDRYIGGVAEKYHFPIDVRAAKARTYEIYLELVPKQLQAFPGARDLVHACRQAGLRLAVASSADRVKIEANLRQIGLPPESWDAIVCGEEVLNKKPAPDIFLAAARKLGFAPDQCVVVEDAVNGVDSAKAAGMRCVAVAQTFSIERLQHADLVRRNLVETSVLDLSGGADLRLDADVPPPVQPTISPNTRATCTRPWGLWATVGLTLVILIAAVITQGIAVIVQGLVMKIFQPGTVRFRMDSSGLLLGIATCACVPVVLGLAYLFARIRNGRDAIRYLGFRPFPLKSLVPWIVGLLLLVAFSDTLTFCLGRPIVAPVVSEEYRTAGFLPLFWVALMVAAPLTEESLFRGFLFEGVLHSRLGATGAVILSALSWSLIHVQYDLYGMGTIFAAGLYLGFARLKIRSLYSTMLMHGMMNFIATVEAAVSLRAQG